MVESISANGSANEINGNSTSGNTSNDSTKPPLRFALRSANSYFNVPRPDAKESSVDPSTPSSKLNVDDSVTTQDAEPAIVESVALKSHKDYEKLELSGNIISACGHIPYAVGITRDGTFELTPRPGSSTLRDALRSLSSSKSWKHTIIGWTGEVLPALSAEFGELVNRKGQPGQTSPAGEGRQLGSVAIHDVSGSGFNETFAQHFKDNDPSGKEIQITKDRRREVETLLENAFNDKIVPVWLGDWVNNEHDTLTLKDQKRWSTYAEENLYQNLHQIFEEEGQGKSDQIFADYRRMNEALADGIVKAYKPGDIIWIHDYQLMLLPEIVRSRLPSAYIAYFHHTNWPPREVMLKIPEHEELLKGVLGASVVGMPSGGLLHYIEDYYRYSLKLPGTGDGVIKYGNRHIKLINVPVGIDVSSVQDAAYKEKQVEQYLHQIRRQYPDKKLIVARVRYDRPKAIRFLLKAFANLLDRHPDLRTRTILFLLSNPSSKQREDDAGHRAAPDPQIAQSVVDVNGRFGSTTYQPIVYLDGHVSPSEYFALLRQVDLAIVTSDHEAVNAMSVEYVVCQNDKCSPLLISERSILNDDSDIPNGSSSKNLSGVEQAAMEIHDNLLQDEDASRADHSALLRYFRDHNVTTFTNEFLLKACDMFRAYCPFKNAPRLDENTLSHKFGSAPTRLFMFDYDGTLTPIVSDPDSALPSGKLLQSLAKLATHDQNKVWLISGRNRAFLSKLFGHIKGLGLSAEHGSFLKQPGDDDWENLAASMDMGWKAEADKLFMTLCEDIEGAWIERKEVAIVWHYRNASDHDACLAKAVEAKANLEGQRLKEWDVEVMLGKANLEVRPRFLNKGVMAARLIQETFGDNDTGFVLCAGDDTTDEGKLLSMFRGLACANVLPQICSER